MPQAVLERSGESLETVVKLKPGSSRRSVDGLKRNRSKMKKWEREVFTVKFVETTRTSTDESKSPHMESSRMVYWAEIWRTWAGWGKLFGLPGISDDMSRLHDLANSISRPDS